MLSKTSLLEARLVAGDSALFKEFRAEFIKRCVVGHERRIHPGPHRQPEERHEKFGQTVYMQEPNIKNGCGGLRDYQNLLWISFFKERVQSTAGLVEKKLLNESEAPPARSRLRFSPARPHRAALHEQALRGRDRHVASSCSSPTS